MIDLDTEHLLSQLPGFGWCTPAKRQATEELIAEHAPQLIVEIGTFGGGWLLPAAIAAPRAFWCVGIDPYDPGVAVEGMTTKENHDWWNNKEMLEGTYAAVQRAIHSLGLRNCVIFRMTSDDAVRKFSNGCIDLLHIDGNHSADPAMRDAKNYLPLVKIGGHIIVDDVGWGEVDANGNHALTVKPMLDWLLANGCEQIKEVGGAAFLRRVA